MAIRLIMTDLDDTLLNQHSQISPRSERALKRAMERGVHLCLASGRMPQAMASSIARLRVSAPVAAYNGALIFDPLGGRPLKTHRIPQSDARALMEEAQLRSLHIQFFDGGGFAYAGQNRFTELYEHSIGVRGRAVGHPAWAALREDVYKLLIIDEPTRTPEILSALQPMFEGRVRMMISRPHYIECTAPTADKGAALQSLMGLLGVAREETIAFGDAQNDLSMLALAGEGYCVANAREEVRRAARFHAPSNAEDGVAQVIEQMLAEGRI